MFPFYYPGLQCLACYWERSCQFVLVDSTVWLPYPLDLFLLILVHVHTSVLPNCTPGFLHMLKRICALTLSCHIIIIVIIIIIISLSQGTVVDIATRYGLDGPGFDPRWRQDFLDLS
jgi:hypothetical protein